MPMYVSSVQPGQNVDVLAPVEAGVGFAGEPEAGWQRASPAIFQDRLDGNKYAIYVHLQQLLVQRRVDHRLHESSTHPERRNFSTSASL
jgi:hypothetical protein